MEPAMDHAGGVSGVQSGDDLASEAEQVAAVQALPLENRIERLSLHQFGDEELLVIRLDEFEHATQTGMDYARDRRHRILQALLAFGVAGREGPQRDQLF